MANRIGLKLCLVVLTVTVVVALQISAGTKPQESAPQPKFEEASIKPCDADSVPAVPEGSRGGGMNSFRMTPGRTHVLCMTLGTLIRTAWGYGPANFDFLTNGSLGPDRRGLQMDNVYGLGVEDGLRVKGGPSWVRSERYSIETVAAGTADAATMSGPMLRELLTRRFQLKVHMETVQVPAYALTAAKGGLKIKPMPEGGCTPPPQGRGAQPPSRADAVRRGEKPYCGMSIERNGPNTVFGAGGQEFSALPQMLGVVFGGTRFLDKTGITGKFNFVLEFAVDADSTAAVNLGPPVGEPPDIPVTSTIVQALQEQLGLTLEKAKAPRDVIVIDSVERPTPN